MREDMGRSFVDVETEAQFVARLVDIKRGHRTSALVWNVLLATKRRAARAILSRRRTCCGAANFQRGKGLGCRPPPTRELAQAFRLRPFMAASRAALELSLIHI